MGYLYLFCLYCMLPPLILYIHFSLLISSLTYLFLLRIDPLRFQTGCRERRLNLALVFFAFILCCSAFLLIGECVHLLCWVQFFSTLSQEIGFGKRLRNDLFCVDWDEKNRN